MIKIIKIINTKESTNLLLSNLSKIERAFKGKGQSKSLRA